MDRSVLSFISFHLHTINFPRSLGISGSRGETRDFMDTHWDDGDFPSETFGVQISFMF